MFERKLALSGIWTHVPPLLVGCDHHYTTRTTMLATQPSKRWFTTVHNLILTKCNFFSAPSIVLLLPQITQTTYTRKLICSTTIFVLPNQLLCLLYRMKPLTGFIPYFLVNAPPSDRKDLLSELELMKKLKPHPHVIKLIGCVTETGKSP